MARLAHPLFAGITVDEAFADQRAKALSEVDALRSADLRTADLPSLRRQLVAGCHIDPLRLEWDARTAIASDDGATVRLIVPFSGASGLFDMRPTRDDGEHPTGWARAHELVLVLPTFRDQAHREFDRQKALLTDWVGRINADVEPRNERLARTVRMRVTFQADRARRTVALALELGPPPPRRVLMWSEDRQPPRARSHAGGPERAIQAHGPGHRSASLEHIYERYEEALAATPEPRTPTAIAAHFRTMDGRHIGISPRHLRRLRQLLRDIEASAG